MALVSSHPMKIGTRASEFTLLDSVSDKLLSLNELKGEKGTVIVFICNHCPYVIHINHELVNIANDYQKKGISFIAISSNDIARYPQDGPVYMKQMAQQLNYPFPYLYDTDQTVAHAYNAACTPDFYLFDKELKSVYHGQLDDSRPSNSIEVNGKDLRSAIGGLLKGETPIPVQKPSSGCSIKWL